MSEQQSVAADNLKANQDYWFWLTEKGLSGNAELHFYSTSTDKTGLEFNRTTSKLKWKVPVRGEEVKGLAKVTSKGNLLLTSQYPIGRTRGILETMQAENASFGSSFNQMIAVRTENGKFAEVTVVSSGSGDDPFSVQVAVLASLKETGDKAYFWFTNRSSDKKPLLLLGTDSKALKAQAAELAGKGKKVRGRVVVDKKDRIEFRVTSDYEDFVADLAAWVIGNVATSPGLARLKNAYLSLRSKEGETLSTQKDRNVWKQLK